jgi:hypothetical protein
MMDAEQVKQGIRETIEHCRKLTLSLVRLSRDCKTVEEIASGFLLQQDDNIYVISAGHALSKPGWVIETTFTMGSTGQTTCIPLKASWTLKKMTLGKTNLENVDIAWAKIDMASFEEGVRSEPRLKGKSFEYLVYKGPLDTSPVPNEFYVYASSNRVTQLCEPGRTYLDRGVSYEYEMQFKEQRKDNGLYVFSVPEYKGRECYQGASGSPILDPSWEIVAVFVGGSKTNRELYGYPIRGLSHLIKVAEESESTKPRPVG